MFPFQCGMVPDNRSKGFHFTNAPATVDMRAASCLHSRKSLRLDSGEWGSYVDSRNFSAAQSNSYCQKWQFWHNNPMI